MRAEAGPLKRWLHEYYIGRSALDLKGIRTFQGSSQDLTDETYQIFIGDRSILSNYHNNVIYL